jgi:hypothetical protein
MKSLHKNFQNPKSAFHDLPFEMISSPPFTCIDGCRSLRRVDQVGELLKEVGCVVRTGGRFGVILDGEDWIAR